MPVVDGAVRDEERAVAAVLQDVGLKGVLEDGAKEAARGAAAAAAGGTRGEDVAAAQRAVAAAGEGGVADEDAGAAQAGAGREDGGANGGQ